MIKRFKPFTWISWYKLVYRTLCYMGFYPGITWREAMIFALEEQANSQQKAEKK